MIIKYNTFNSLDRPQYVLCNPGAINANSTESYSPVKLSKVIGTINNIEDDELIINFNAMSELNFRVKLAANTESIPTNHDPEIFQAIQNRRLIYMTDVGFFVITQVEDGYEGEQHYKNIQAKSIESELQQYGIPYIADGTYKFYTPYDPTMGGAAPTDILSMIVARLPLWTIGHVDNSLVNRYRTFEDVDVTLNCLAFLIDKIQEAYECVVIFDCINRIINIYDQSTYIRTTNIHIRRDDVIKSLQITEDANDLYTALRVTNDDGFSIRAVNPTGTDVIYNFSYYLSWMSDELQAALAARESAITTTLSSLSYDSYADLSYQYYMKLQEVSDCQSESRRIEILIQLYERCRNNIVSDNASLLEQYNEAIAENGGDPISIAESINETLAAIDSVISDLQDELDSNNALLSTIEAEKIALESDRNTVNSVASFADNPLFTDELYEELTHYIFEGSYTDDYVAITDSMTYAEKIEQMLLLMDRATETLNRVSTPTQQFTVDTENFVFAKEFERWCDQLETGCLINVEIETDNVAPLFLTTITVNYDDYDLQLTFGNRYNKFDPRSLFEDVLGQISSSANSIDYLKDLIAPIKYGELNQMQQAIQDSRDLSLIDALASEGEEVVIDGSGYTGRHLNPETGEYDPQQIKITGKNIVFTEDGWDSCSTAIGSLHFAGGEIYGVNAQALIGDIIIGNNLQIYDSSGQELLSAVDGRIATRVAELNIDELSAQVSSLVQTASDLTILFENYEPDQVTTATGYKFNADGLTIRRSNDEVQNLINNTGMYVSRYSGDSTPENILSANNEGVTALNLRSNQYLIIGEHSRLENYSNGTDNNRTACYFIS